MSKKQPVAQEQKPEWEGEFTIADTTFMMTSPNYKVRFVAEYVQLKVRYEKLKFLLRRWEAFREKFGYDYDCRCGDARDLVEWLGFKPSCSERLLLNQLCNMEAYLHSLEVRAAIEDIDLRKVVVKL